MFAVIDLHKNEILFSYEKRESALNMANYLNRYAPVHRCGVMNLRDHKDAYPQEVENAISYV